MSADRDTTRRVAAQVRGELVERVVVSTPLDPWLSLSALANYSGLSTRTLRTFIEQPPERALPHYRIGHHAGKVLVKRGEFDRWMAQWRHQGRPSLVKALRDLGLADANH